MVRCPAHSCPATPALTDTPYHHGHLRETLIASALALEPEHGALGLSLRQVAKHAGVSHAAVYHHFENKEALVVGVARSGFARLLMEMDIELDRAPDAFFALVMLGAEYLRFAFGNPSLFRFMYISVPAGDDVRDDPLAAEHDAVLARFRRAVECAQAGALIKRGPAVRPAAQFWGLAHGLASLTVSGAIDGAPAGRKDRKSDAQRQRRAFDLVRSAMVGLMFGMRAADSAWTPGPPGTNGAMLP